jgi:hypothetical protein
MQGRKPKATEAHLIEGTFNSTRHGDRPELVSSNSLPIPPVELDDDVREVWDFYVPLLHWNEASDSDAFLQFCDFAADFRKSMTGRQTKYDWTASMFGQYSKLRAEVGIGYVQRMQMVIPKDDNKKETKASKHFK